MLTRPEVHGKFFFVDGRKFLVRGVTYGPFAPDTEGCEYKTPGQVRSDFRAMRGAGINSVRTYTAPPRWLLDEAQRHGLRVMVGLPWEQHITFLDRAGTRRSIQASVRQAVRRIAGHPALLAFAVGNEIPASIVRWYGRRPVEKFIEGLYRVVKEEDPTALVTYVNFPTTEYLQLGFLDFLCFNVYLEEREDLARYLSRLQNLADDQPLLMGEVGLDSQRNGHEEQASTLQWQIETTFSVGCAGMFVFAWTDEWHRGGFDIEDWDFGLTTREREPKPALGAVERAYAGTPFPRDRELPRVSVVVCTYNGSATINETIHHVFRLAYPCYEVLVVNDGSTDATAGLLADLAPIYPELRVIEIPNGGLSNARNVGMREAGGEVVAYIDDDAYPDPHWLDYLVEHLLNTDHVGVGGPNLPVVKDGPVATCVAHSPGGPNHVLLGDRLAEHIPGCNMCFWKEKLEAVGGFDPTFRIAGDDVDLCWRLQEQDGAIGFHPAAVVWHHRRPSVKAYLRQQTNYGKAEAMLESKWPGKYNQFGHVVWKGQVYGRGLTLPLLLRPWRIYHGVWGSSLFQSLYRRPAGMLQAVPLMPEWYLLWLAVALLMLPALIWQPAWFAPALAAVVLGIPIGQAVFSARGERLPSRYAGSQRLRCRTLIAALHVLQPIARLRGRLMLGLAPWKRQGRHRRLAFPRIRNDRVWSEQWRSPEQRLEQLEAALLDLGVGPIRGGTYDRWDLEVYGGLFGAIRLKMAIEEHGGGQQLVRLAARPRISRLSIVGLIISAALLAIATALLQIPAMVILAIITACLLVRAFGDCAMAMGGYREALGRVGDEDGP